MDPIRKTSGFGYGYGPLKALINPPLSLRKISYKYNSMLTYIPVSFFFSFIFRVRVRVKNRVRDLGFWVSFRLGLRFGFGIGNLIGGAAGTVDPCARKTPVNFW